MRAKEITMRAILMLIVVLLCRPVIASDDAQPGNPPGEAAAKSEADAQVAPGATDGETWRYRRHNGRWWYWLPSNRWVVWTGDQWVNHEETARQSRPAGGVQRQRSYSSSDSQGNWGPKRYDRWGQPEYPYSKRKSGLKQLGPVPAMGGVRSLPGWGGER
jgi:hypothetical protein